jgi:HEAT repeat protein
MECSKDEFEKLIQQLKYPDWETRCSAVTTLGKLGDKRAVGPLIRVYFDQSSLLSNYFYPSITQLLSVALDRCMLDWPYSEEARKLVPDFIAALQHKNLHVRLNAASVLGRVGDKRAMEPLIQCLNDDNSDVVGCSAIALGKIGDLRAVVPLISALEKTDIQAFLPALYIIEALGVLGDGRAVRPLITRLKEKRRVVHTGSYGEIAKALGQLKDAEAIEPLIEFTRVNRSSKAGVLVNMSYEILGLLLSLVIPISDAIGEGRVALRSILAANKPLLRCYPDLYCSKCRSKAQRHYGWPTFYHRISYVTCRNCGSSLHLTPIK